MLDSLLGWLAAHQFPCAWKQLFGISCPMCGCQRGVWLLAQGEWGDALLRFPPLAAWTLSLVLLAVCSLRGRLSRRTVNGLLIGNLVILLANGVWQNVYDRL